MEKANVTLYTVIGDPNRIVKTIQERFKEMAEELVCEDETVDLTLPDGTHVIFSIKHRQLLRQEIYDNESNLLVKYTYEYDNASGSISHLEFPMWFLGWWYYNHVYSYDFKNVQFLNHHHNITKITSENSERNRSSVTYTYKYNKNNFPVSVFCDKWEDEEVGIRY